MASSAVGGLGAGLGTLFSTLGRQKLNSARWDLAKAQLEQKRGLIDEQTREAKSKADLGDSINANRGNFDPTALINPNADLSARAAALRYGALGNLGSNVSAMLDSYGKGRSQERIDAAQTALTGGNDALGNRFLALASGKPLQTTSVSGGVAFDQYGNPSQPVNVTPAGLGDIMAKKAAAANSNAQANAANARARLFNTQTAAGGFNPHASGDLTKPSEPPISQLGTLLGQSYDPGTGLVSVPQERMRQFLAWQANKGTADPRYNNGSFALQHYATEAPLGSGVNDSPADVGALAIGTAPRTPQAPEASSAPARKVVRTGHLKDGRKVVQYEDGSVEYVD